MNSEKVQTIINEIISDLHTRIGGKAARKQYPVSKHQIATLTELGIIEFMPKGFGHADAKAVIEEAQRGSTAVMNAYGEGESIGASKLYRAINEVAKTIEAQTFTVSERDNEIEIDGEIFFVNVNNDNTVSIEIDGGVGEAYDVDGSVGYSEIDGMYEVARLEGIDTGDSYDHEFEITITPEMIADAKAYRTNYPLNESEF